jgi:hypothetical protein
MAAQKRKVETLADKACKTCEQMESGELVGSYDMGCAKCCARHLLLAKDFQHVRDVLLQSILFFKRSPPKEKILVEYEQLIQSKHLNT